MKHFTFWLLLIAQGGFISSGSVGHLAKELERSGGSQCYGDLGCFPGMYLISTDEFPYTPEEINLQIKLYTRNSRSTPTVFKYTEAAKLADSGFNSSLPTKFIVHGFGGYCEKDWVLEMKNALFTKMNLNVFCVDWKNGALHPRYAKAASTTQIVGKMVSIFVKEMNEIFGDMRSRLHLIGFSLGAQICGNVGSAVPGISRISGLDPAGPIFGTLGTSKKLDKTDALFVDVIHTNGDDLINGGLGNYQPSGHVDFYPNGGKNQLGCPNFISANIKNVVNSLFNRPSIERTCNHRRSLEVFTESISGTCVLNGFPCSTDWEGFKEGLCFDVSTAIPIGLNANIDPTREGNFYLAIRDKVPVCGTQLRVTIDVDDPSGKQRSFKGTVKIIFGERATIMKEKFTLLDGFSTPMTDSHVFTVDEKINQEIITLKYEQSGLHSIGTFDRSELKVNFVKITDGITGETVTWMVNSTSKIIKSGDNNVLHKQQ